MDQSLWLANQKQGVVVRSYLLHSSLAGAHLCCAVSILSTCKCAGQSHFSEPNWHVLTFLHPIWMCMVPYWAPLGNALSTQSMLTSVGLECRPVAPGVKIGSTSWYDKLKLPWTPTSLSLSWNHSRNLVAWQGFF